MDLEYIVRLGLLNEQMTKYDKRNLKLVNKTFDDNVPRQEIDEKSLYQVLDRWELYKSYYIPITPIPLEILFEQVDMYKYSPILSQWKLNTGYFRIIKKNINYINFELVIIKNSNTMFSIIDTIDLRNKEEDKLEKILEFYKKFET